MAVTGKCGRGGVQPENGAGDVPGQPADQREQAAEEHIDGVVAGHRGGESLAREFALARAGDPDKGERGEAAEDVDRGCAARVKKTCAKRKTVFELSQPATAPCPMGDEGKNESREHRCCGCACGHAETVSARAPRNDGSQRHGHEFKEQGELGPSRGGGKIFQTQGAGACPIPWFSGEVKDVGGTGAGACASGEC